MASRTYPADQLITQSHVCDVLGISARTLARRFSRYDAGGNGADIPPFVMVGKYRKWRYDYVVAFKERRTCLHALQEHGYPPGKIAVAPEAPRPHTELSVRAVVRMIEGWKVSELHRRYQAIADPSAKTLDLLAAHQAERRLLYDEEGNRRRRDDPGVTEACNAKAKQIVQPDGTAYLPDQLAPLMQTVWEQVLETEREWLLGRV
jgi:hypothetical protein